jgi:histidine ammonia-lyase
VTDRKTVEIGGDALTFADVDLVAIGAADVSFGPAARARAEKSHAFMKKVAASDAAVYGLTTGCGPLAHRRIDPRDRERFQRNLVRSHAVSLGEPLPSAFVRAAMTVRAHVLARGYSGVDPAAIETLVGMINAGVHPIVREVGSVGASGDLVELAQIALAVLGEGDVQYGGAITSAANALKAAGLKPLTPVHREGLALMNGTSCHTGAAAVVLAKGKRVAHAGEVAAVMVLEALCGKSEAFDDAFQRLRPHAGQGKVAALLASMTRGSRLLDAESPAGSQDAYTLRCIPQVLGTVEDSLDAAREVIATELGSVSDNPLFLIDEDRVVHGGNFHGQPVAMALDQIKIAMVELGVMSERRLARLLDPQLNRGLPAFLAGEDDSSSGFMGLQFCSSSMAADNAVLAAPVSVHSVPTNANNQDVVSMGMVAARQAARVLDNVERMVAIELLCAAQALDVRGSEHAGVGTRAVHRAIREHISVLREDRPLRNDVDAARGLIASGALLAALL